MVGDEKDRRRWQQVHGHIETARRLRERAIQATEENERRKLLRASEFATARAHSLIV